jgi:acyl-CoA thioesterase FadM
MAATACGIWCGCRGGSLYREIRALRVSMKARPTCSAWSSRGAFPAARGNEIPIAAHSGRVQPLRPGGDRLLSALFRDDQFGRRELLPPTVGRSFARMHDAGRNGVPTVRIEADLSPPLALGRPVLFTWRLHAVGGSSVRLVTVEAGGQGRGADAGRPDAGLGLTRWPPAPWPDEVRARIAQMNRRTNKMSADEP